MPEMNVFGDLNVRGNRVVNAGDPVAPTDLAPAGYVDDAVADKVKAVNGLTGVWKGSQAEYDALGTHDPTVLYIVT